MSCGVSKKVSPSNSQPVPPRKNRTSSTTGAAPRIRQVDSAQLRIRLFPGQGENISQAPPIHNIHHERIVAFDGNCTALNATHRQPADKPEQRFNFILKSRAHRALILFPALGTPALVHPEQKSIYLILAIDDAFHQATRAEQVNGRAGPMTLRRLHAQLRLYRWKNGIKRAPGIKRLYPISPPP